MPCICLFASSEGFFFFKWSLCVPNHLSESGVVSFLHLAIFLKMGRTTIAAWAPAAMWTQLFYYPLQVGFLSVLLSPSAIDGAVKESGKDLHLLDTDASQLMVSCVLLPTSPWEHNGGSNDSVIAWIFFYSIQNTILLLKKIFPAIQSLTMSPWPEGDKHRA